MELKHTPEPWKADKWGGNYIWGPNMEMIADYDDEWGLIVRMRGAGANVPQQKNAERIAACVNACAGMADPAAEIAELRHEVKKLFKQLEIAERNAAIWEYRATDRNNAESVEELRSVITQLRADKARLIEAVKESTDIIFWSNETGDKSMIRIVNSNKQLLTEMEDK